MKRTNVPAFHGLGTRDLVCPKRDKPGWFPLSAPNHRYFYRARNAIYHLFRALRSPGEPLTVLAPDYNSGNEVLAMQAAGARISRYPIGPDMQLQASEVERLCSLHQPDVLYVTHYLGWPQPMGALADLCERRGVLLVEDCALALLSELDGRPVGSFGHFSIFCLYKTLPLPNGAMLVENSFRLAALDEMKLRRPGPASVLGRAAELVALGIRQHAERPGRALHGVKRTIGRFARAFGIHASPIGDIGFDPGDADLSMSALSRYLLKRLDVAAIRRRRIGNFRQLAELVDGRVTLVKRDLPDGVCPLFFPILVSDKRSAAETLGKLGIETIEFWNDSVETAEDMSAAARFLHAHVLELPIHQDLDPAHIAFMAKQLSSTNLRFDPPAESLHAA
jgi:dTDP-4-amino-4,6-dideoxygalactose transaminase